MDKGYIFNEFGLRFDIKHLQAIRRKIIDMPVETQAEYVDAITYQNCSRASHEPLAHPFDPTHADELNATSIGNVAFVSLYHPLEVVRGFAQLQLEAIKRHFA